MFGLDVVGCGGLPAVGILGQIRAGADSTRIVCDENSGCTLIGAMEYLCRGHGQPLESSGSVDAGNSGKPQCDGS
jgi:hypothetical protein